MKEVASRGSVDNSALMQYVIDGINDLSVNKSILYNAKEMKELKEKLKWYEKIRSKCGKSKNYDEKFKHPIPKDAGAQKDSVMQKKLHCYNCGEVGHTSNQCANRSNGRKSFNCNNFGHISKDCPESKKETVANPSNTRKVSEDKLSMLKEIYMKQKKFKALLDTGSKYNIISETTYLKLNKPKLSAANIFLAGFGNNNKVKPFGSFKEEFEDDSQKFQENFLVVSSDFLDVDVVLVAEFCNNAKTQINHDSQTERSSLLKITVESAKKFKTKTKTTNVEMRIIFKDDTPVHSCPRRMAFSEKCIIDDQIEQ
ncbi:uncharacterized protein LOC120322014 [Drosophila yakuba]|uniref:uncharacterized protein LOC120322014 n=1 Tax=Drosophila yakuba TaxID=7245 RepID=UPI0019308897|nr:uncharacterized protein LOC120322014 [Drosophila yakuba]